MSNYGSRWMVKEGELPVLIGSPGEPGGDVCVDLSYRMQHTLNSVAHLVENNVITFAQGHSIIGLVDYTYPHRSQDCVWCGEMFKKGLHGNYCMNCYGDR